MTHDGYLLSSENPIATVDQRELEDVALRLLKRPELQKARAVATLLWRQVSEYPARDQMSRFDNMIDEYMFHYTSRAVNSDANHPKVLRFMAPPHHWFGRDVPGSRWGGDSPDFIYRTIPIAHGGRYEIRGRPTGKEPPTVTYQLIATRAAPVSLGLLDSLDIATEESGDFVLTIDETAADGRTNHLQTKPGADHLMIRDALGDWLTQRPNDLRVRRLNPPDRAPLSEEELAQRAAQSALDGLYYTYYTTQSGAGQLPNEVRVPVSSGAFGGMPTQWGTKGNLYLGEDEALIATANAAGAVFRNVMLTDAFHMSINYWSSTSSFNMLQMAADDDGRFTYVVAHKDPGVHNWLDTNGLTRTIFGHRWQSIPCAYSGETPTISVRTVQFRELEKELPAGIRRIDATARREQIARREAGFKQRFIER